MRELKSPKSYKDKAKKAANKPASLGEDIDLNAYASSTEELPYQGDPSQLPPQTKEKMMQVGVVLDDTHQRAGTIIQVDNSVIHSLTSQEGIEVMSTSQALKEYGWLVDYWWKAVVVDSDKYTAHVELNQGDGY